jgi:DNA adenine methylase
MQDLTNYPGAKNGSGVFQNIINLFPPHDIYIEPFLGSGAIIKRKKPAGINIGLDISGVIIKKHDAGHGFFYQQSDALHFLSSAASLLNALSAAGTKILIYCDPPYPLSSRRSQLLLYDHEMSDHQHETFLSLVRNLKCYVVISSYFNKLYSDSLSDWRQISIPTTTRGGTATEIVWFNFEPSHLKHQYNFLGQNFRDRAAKKGRVLRNLKHIQSLPQDEQYYLMDLLTKKIQL